MIPRQVGRGLRAVALLAAFVATTGCDAFDDLGSRFRTCEDVTVVLVNDPQTLEAVNLIGPDEIFEQSNLLRSGESRAIGMCIQRGDRKRFRVRNEAFEEIAAVNCVASLSSYETVKPQVSWSPHGLGCKNW
jgi:hypothetical protein